MKAYASFGQLTEAGYLGSGTIILSYQTTLLRMLESASEEIDHFCHRHFDCWEGTQYFDGAGWVFIPNEDILSISEIALDISGSGTYGTVLSPTTDYLMYPISGPQSYPKNMLKMRMSSGIGYFASGIRAGVKITGVFGHGDGNSATPYHVTAITGSVTTTNGTTLTLSAEGTIQAGHTIRVGTEQMYVTAVSSNDSKTATVTRGVNGTTATIHTPAAASSIYDYPGPVVEATLLLATGWWKQRENPATYMSGDSISGTYTITKDMESIIVHRLSHLIKRKLI